MKSFLPKITFILILFTCGHICRSQEISACTPIQEGYFEYDIRGTNVLFYRENNLQIEYNMDRKSWIATEINWKENCSYTISFIDTNDKGVQRRSGPIRIEVTSFDTSGYSYYFEIDGTRYPGKIRTIAEEKVNKKHRKVIKKVLNSVKKRLST